jgi:ABC-type multidrug transport system fused ATPase/permease subunit
MLKAVKASFAFMKPRERRTWLLLTSLRSLLSILDLVGIMAVGFIIASTAAFFASGSDPDRLLVFGGIGIPAVDAQTLPWVSSGVLVLFLGKALFSLLLLRKTAIFAAKIEAQASMQIAKVTLGRDLVRARENSRDEVLFAMQVGAPSAISGVFNQLGTIIAEGSLFLIVVLGFLVIDPWITLAAIGYFAIIAYLIQFFVGTLMKRAGESVATGTVGASSLVNDLFSVFRESSVLRNRSYYLKGVLEFRSKASRGAASQYFLSGMPRYILESALLIGVGAFVVLQSLSGDLVASAATIGIFLTGGFRLTAAMLPLQSALLTMKALLPAAGKAHDILALRTEDETTQPLETSLSYTSVTIDRPAATGIGVSVRGVTYTYPSLGELVLDDLNMEIPAGSQVAIIGPSGSGKSTIADIICGILTPDKGSVELSFPRSHSSFDIQPTVSYVPQKPGLVAGTIAQNVALGLDEKLINRELVSECLERAHLSDVVGALPHGIDSDLGKLQDSLSGGQAQRLGLARALYTFPGLLVMDEATSALDGESESEIAKVLESLRGSVTVVLIAHRLNTVQHANNVFLVQNGRIVDEGPFVDLVNRNPSMRRLVAHSQLQAKE